MLKKARYALLDKMDAEVARIKSTGTYDEAASRVTGFPMGAMIYDYGESTYSYDAETKEMTVIEFDIRSHFELAGKILFTIIIIPRLGIWGIILCEPLIWCEMAVQLAFAYRGRVKKISEQSL